ncbi:MAG: type II toxin-antitoxin system VapC family toxin [Thermomicrobiales bacterium]
MSYLLDTNVVSEGIKPRAEPTVLAWLDNVGEDGVFLSVATFAEIRNGIELLTPGRRRDRLEGWIEEIAERFRGRILPIDRHIAEAWGVINVRRRRVGSPIDALDAFFAATAEVHGLTLATRNERDFARLGIDVFNPWMYEPPTEEERVV